VLDVIGRDGQDAQAGVGQQLHPDAAEPDGEHRAERVIDGHADQQFHAAGPHRRDQHPVDEGPRHGLGGGQHPPVGVPDLRVAVHAERDAADVGFVGDLSGAHLERHR